MGTSGPAKRNALPLASDVDRGSGRSASLCNHPKVVYPRNGTVSVLSQIFLSSSFCHSLHRRATLVVLLSAQFLLLALSCYRHTRYPHRR
jgi:hypothetical protein